MPTIKQIASVAGVSRGTVDRVINKRGNVKPETEKRIREALELLNYVPNKAGRTLAMQKKGVKYGFIFFSQQGDSRYFKDVEFGVLSRAKTLSEYGVAVDIRYIDDDDTNREIELMDYFLSNGYNGIGMMPFNNHAVAEKISELYSRGVPVVTVSSDIEHSMRAAYVGSDYIRGGETAAGMMNLICSGSANVALVCGSLTEILCNSERAKGFALKTKTCYPGIRICDTIEVHDDEIENYLKVSKMLILHKEIDAVLISATELNGICKAISECGRKIHAVCYDCLPETKNYIRSGVIDAAIDQNPKLQGEVALNYLFEYSTSSSLTSTSFLTEPSIIIRENI